MAAALMILMADKKKRKKKSHPAAREVHYWASWNTIRCPDVVSHQKQTLDRHPDTKMATSRRSGNLLATQLPFLTGQGAATSNRLFQPIGPSSRLCSTLQSAAPRYPVANEMTGVVQQIEDHCCFSEKITDHRPMKPSQK